MTPDGQRTMQDGLDEIAAHAERVAALARDGLVMSKEWWVALRDSIRAQERLLREVAP